MMIVGGSLGLIGVERSIEVRVGIAEMMIGIGRGIADGINMMREIHPAGIQVDGVKIMTIMIMVIMITITEIVILITTIVGKIMDGIIEITGGMSGTVRKITATVTMRT